MDSDAYLFLMLAGLTMAAISMQPVIWIAWGAAFLVVCLRLAYLAVRLFLR